MLAERGRLTLANERFQKGVEMLSAQELHVRLGGIYSLRHLATEHPERYHLQTLKVFCSFLRSHTAVKTAESEKEGPALAEVLRAIGNCTSRQIEVEAAGEFYMRLSGVDLSGIEWLGLDIPGDRLNFSSVVLTEAKLKGVHMPRAFLFQAALTDTDLSDAYMPGAMLDSCHAYNVVFANAKLDSSNFDNAQVSGADFTGANLSRGTFRGTDLQRARLCGAQLQMVDFERANVSGTDFTGCRGVTQTSLDRAVAAQGNPPILEGAVDHETGHPLVWQGLEPAPGGRFGRLHVEHRILPSSVDRFPLWGP